MNIYNENNNWTVYIHISPSNKKYVGITSRPVEERWKNGLGYIKNDHFYRAILKYGWDNFQHIIIANHLSKKDACNLEIELIKKYNSNDYNYGYNISSGGESGKKSVPSSKLQKEVTSRRLKELWQDEEYRLKMLSLSSHDEEWRNNHSCFMKKKWEDEEYRKSRIGKNCHFYGMTGENNYNYGKCGILSSTSKKVICVTTLEVFSSITEASEAKGSSVDVISRGCNKHIDQKRRDKNGNIYIWRFYSEYLKENNLTEEDAKKSLFFFYENTKEAV